MAQVRSEGYGAEWIGVPDELLPILETYSFHSGRLVFVVSRQDTALECYFVSEQVVNGQAARTMFLGTSWDTRWVPDWVSFPGVPQYLFDNLLASLLKARQAAWSGRIPILPEQQNHEEGLNGNQNGNSQRG